jgi:hypothetical protein
MGMTAHQVVPFSGGATIPDNRLLSIAADDATAANKGFRSF